MKRHTIATGERRRYTMYKTEKKMRLGAIALCLLFGAIVGYAEEGQWVTHSLRAGETIYGLSRTYSVPVGDILEYNGISDPSTLSEGAEIVLPGVYEVKPGDTLYSLSRTYDVELSELMRLNDLDGNDTLRIGQHLALPAVDPGAGHNPSGDSSEIADSNGTGSAGSSEGGGSPSDGRNPDDLDHSGGANTAGQSVENVEVDSNAAGNGNATLVWPHDGQRSERGGRVPGVRIDAAVGDQVRAVASGTVTFVGPYAGFGEVVIVESPTGYIYVYGGNSQLRVEVGETVERGSVLGVVGTVGSSSEVHFSVWHDDNPIDPENAPRS